MPKGFIVKLPMGMGKTRIVIAHILWGTGTKLSGWNRRLKRIVILIPNHHVKRAWIRELLLLSLSKRMISHCTEDEIRNKGTGGLENLLACGGIISPKFVTFSKIKNSMKLGRGIRCHYLVVDEWHRIPQRMREDCREFIRHGSVRKWFIGGRNVKKRVYFVSATPVNPVLEQELEIEEEAYDYRVFRDRVLAATANAVDVIKAVLGKRNVNVDGNFLEVIDSMEVQEIKSYGKKRLKWEMPSEAKISENQYYDESKLRPPELDGIKHHMEESLSPSNLNNYLISREYAYSTGLIRTRQKHKRGPHFLYLSRNGVRRCFGEAYKTLYIPDEFRRIRMKATSWLWEKHTRMKRLVNLLIDEDVLTVDKKGVLNLTNRKVLIFCTHLGVALGLVKGLEEQLNYSFGNMDNGLPAIATNVNKTSEYVERMITEFNRSKNPIILVLTDVLSEGIDLHEKCNLLVHYELPWSPLRLFQRIGRLTRLKTRGNRVMFNRNVRIAHTIIPGGVEEERINRLIRRIEFLSKEKLWPREYKNPRIVTGLIGSGPSLHYKEYKERGTKRYL